MRSLVVALLVGVLALTVAAPALAADMVGCDHPMEPTLESLHHCVMHAAEQGIVDNSGVATSLLSKVGAAQLAYDRGQSAAAAKIVQAFILELQAQSGKHIAPDHAQHMTDHAVMVIEALLES